MKLSKIMMREGIQKLIRVGIGLFALFIIYQIVRILLGGSWVTESIILSIVMLNVATTFSIGWQLAEMKAEVKHLAEKIDKFSADFKEHVKAHS